MPDRLSESSDERSDQQVVIKVAVAVPLRKLFDYLVPASLHVPQSGCRVNVQFGSRTMTGLVIEVCDSSLLDKEKLRAIKEVLDSEPLLDNQHLQFLGWVADYYLHPAGEVFLSALPKLLRKGRRPGRRGRHRGGWVCQQQ